MTSPDQPVEPVDDVDQAAVAGDSTAFAAGVATAASAQATQDADDAAATAEAAAATAQAAAEVASDAADTAYVTREELEVFRSETDDRLGAIAAGQDEILARLSNPAPAPDAELAAPPEKAPAKTDRSADADTTDAGKDQPGGQPSSGKKGRADGFSATWFGKG